MKNNGNRPHQVLELSPISGHSANGTTTLDNHLAISYKVKHTHMWSSNPTSRCLPPPPPPKKSSQKILFANVCIKTGNNYTSFGRRRLNRLSCIHTVGRHSATKREAFPTRPATRINLKWMHCAEWFHVCALQKRAELWEQRPHQGLLGLLVGGHGGGDRTAACVIVVVVIGLFIGENRAIH